MMKRSSQRRSRVILVCLLISLGIMSSTVAQDVMSLRRGAQYVSAGIDDESSDPHARQGRVVYRRVGHNGLGRANFPSEMEVAVPGPSRSQVLPPPPPPTPSAGVSSRNSILKRPLRPTNPSNIGPLPSRPNPSPITATRGTILKRPPPPTTPPSSAPSLVPTHTPSVYPSVSFTPSASLQPTSEPSSLPLMLLTDRPSLLCFTAAFF